MCEDEDIEITLQTLKDYLKLHKNIESFLREKCRQYYEASRYGETYQSEFDEDIFLGFLIGKNSIDVEFCDDPYSCEPARHEYELPLDILFDNNYYEILLNKYKDQYMKTKEKCKAEHEKKEKLLYEQLKAKYEGEN